MPLVAIFMLAPPSMAQTTGGVPPASDLPIASIRPGENPVVRNRLTEFLKSVSESQQGDRLRPDLGYVITVDQADRLLVAPSSKQPGEILIDAEALEKLRAKPHLVLDIPGSLDRRAIIANLITQRVFGQTQSIDPDSVPTKGELPPAWQSRARELNWTGPEGNRPAKCPPARTRFLIEVEDVLFSKEGTPTSPMAEPSRSATINAAATFDTECLSAVAVGSAEYPTNRIAILQSAGRVPFCTGVHLGSDRFLTARHCFFDRSSGERTSYSQGAVLSLADGSALDVKVLDPASGGATSGHAGDVLVVRASGLPAAVLGRSQISVEPPAALAKATLIGYFAAADPAKLIPQAGGQSGSFPDWRTALRRTREEGIGYCRIWDWTTATDRGCIVHSCQTITGFSGAPLFVSSESGWKLVGIHVSSGAKLAENGCSNFASGRAGSVIGNEGSVAARVTNQFVQAALASSSRSLAQVEVPRTQGGF